MARLLVFVLAISMAACAALMSTVTEPEKPNVMDFPPPVMYYVWYAQVMDCSSRTRAFDSLSFAVAPRPLIRVDSGEVYKAFLVFSEKKIYFGLGYETVDWVVRHEMLHYLLNQANRAQLHDSTYFHPIGGKCGSLVNPPA